MKKSAELKQERALKIQAQTELRNAAQARNESLNETEATAFRALQVEIDGLNLQITDEENFEANQRSIAGGAPSGLDGEVNEKRKMQERFNIGAALRMAGTGKFSGVEAEINEMGAEELRAANKDVSEYSLNIPASMVRASAQTAGQDSGAYGGALIVDQTPRLVESFIPKLFLEELGATMFTGLTGGAVPLPVMENFNFTWADETEEISSQKSGVAGPKLSPKRAGAVVLISNRLLNQSSIDVQSKIMSMLGQGAARALNSAAISGLSANKQPVGIINMSGILAAAQTSSSAATWAKIVELQGLLDSNDASDVNRGYLCSPKLLAALKTIPKQSSAAAGFLAENGLIDGYKTVATSLVPSTPAVTGSSPVPELHNLIFGDFSQLFIGQWGGIQFVVDPLTAASSASLKVVVNMEADIQVANKKAFAINSFLTA